MQQLLVAAAAAAFDDNDEAEMLNEYHGSLASSTKPLSILFTLYFQYFASLFFAFYSKICLLFLFFFISIEMHVTIDSLVVNQKNVFKRLVVTSE